MECTHCREPLPDDLPCPSCGRSLALARMLEREKLVFLLARTQDWPIPAGYRAPFQDRLRALDRPQLADAPAVEPVPEPEAISPVEARPEPVPRPDSAAAESAPAPAAPAAAAPAAAAPAERVPFDQWLLSERNIKLALYAGGLLLVMAGLIFVGANWARIPGAGKFAVTLSMTGLMFLGGLALYRRPTLRIGGVALLAVAGGFLPLNLIVLQIYVLGPAGVDPGLTTVLGSAACLALYALMARWMRSALFATFTVLALVIGVAGLISLLPAAWQDWYALIYMTIAFLLLLLARLNRPSAYLHWPLFVSAQLLVPLATFLALSEFFGEPESVSVSALCVLSYVLTDLLWGWRWARWLAVGAAFVAYTDLLIALGFEPEELPKGWIALSLVYMAVGYGLHQFSGRLLNGMAFYLGGAGMAGLVTLLAGGVAIIEGFSREASVDLALALLVDTVLLLLATAVSRKWYWLYAAAWFFILPASLTLYILALGVEEIGLSLGLLGLLYTFLGYLVGRRTLVWGGAFLSAAAGLSAISVMLAWEETLFAGLLLAGFAALYLLVARWLRWSFLLLPAWLALDLLLVVLSRLIDLPRMPAGSALNAAVFFSGLLLVAGSALIRRAGSRDWAWPLMLSGVVNIGLAYWDALTAIGGWYALTLSAVLVAFGLILAWTEYRMLVRLDTSLSQLDLARIITLLSLGVSFILLYLLLYLGLGTERFSLWAPVAALYCSALLLLSRLIRPQPFDQIYGLPMQIAGLAATPFVLILSLVSFEPLTVAATFLIAGLANGAYWLMKRNRYGIYLSVGLLVVAYWALLVEWNVYEPQAYVIPLGLLLLAAGQVERRAGRNDTYMLSAVAGLGLLMGTALLQSLSAEAWLYPLLLLVEGFLAMVAGILTHSRIYVQLGVLGLAINSVIQLGPAFLRLPSWVHLAVAGVLLLGGGLLALFRRETIIALRSEVGEVWKDWNP